MTMQNPQTCLSAELLRQLSHDELSPAELKDVEDHVSDCERCRQLLEVPQSDPQWRDEIVPILRSPAVAGTFHVPYASGHGTWNVPATLDHDEIGSEGESLESILRLLGPTDDPHMLGRIGSYEVVGVIGRGGMGVVFKAYEGALNRFVAIKMLLPHLAASGAARKRFAREGQAAAAVIDDNVMPIYSVAEWQGVPYLVTQYSRGATLQKRIQDQGPLELKEILRIGMQTARGLAAAHAQGLVHRDVKPSNILLDGTVERALLTDFGLARAVDDASITRTGIIAGTPQYMSPEQARGGSVDARSDLFGLGCVLYAMCTGHPPFRADSSYAILRMITDDEPRSIREINPDIPEWLCLLISRLMAKSPDARFGNALEVAALLEQCLAHVQQPTSVPLPASLVTQAAGRRSIFNSTRKGMIAMLGTIGMTLLGLVLLHATEAPDIGGQWTSDEWGTVVLEATQPGQYRGTMTDSFLEPGPAPQRQGKTGKIELKWSRLEQRFNGTFHLTWNQPANLSGKLSIRLVDNEIRGAWRTDKDAQKQFGSPRLADLWWKRSRNTPKDAYLEFSVDTELRYRFNGNPELASPWTGAGQRFLAKADSEWKPVSRADVSKLFRDRQTILIHVQDNAPYEWVQEIIKSAAQRLNVTVRVVRMDSEVTVIPGPAAATGNALQGKIQRVDAERGVAWINLGTANSVKLGMKFEVRAIATEDAKDRAPVVKGSAEVIRILDQHLSEVRIIQNDSEDKLTENDVVIGVIDPKSLAAAANQFNTDTAEVRSTLFAPPIPDLTSERLREGFRQTADVYRRQGKRQVAEALENIAESGKLPKEASHLIGSGAHGKDVDGGTIYRQVAPALTLPDDTIPSRNLLVLLRPLELWYQKDGPISKDYGDHFQPEQDELEGVWEQVLPPDEEAKIPKEQRYRMVFAGDWFATFQGSKRISASRFTVEPQHTPKRIANINLGSGDGLEFDELVPARGIYEIKDGRVRFNFVRDTEALPTKFGIEHPEFKRVNGKLAQAQLDALKLYSKQAASQRMDGEWELVELVVDGTKVDVAGRGMKVVVQNGHLTYFYGGKDQTKFAVFRIRSLGVANPPSIIDAEVVNGIGRNQFQVLRGIYELKGDELLICLPEKADFARPAKFESLPGSALQLFRLRRTAAQPAPAHDKGDKPRAAADDSTVPGITPTPREKQDWCLKLLEDDSNPEALRSALTVLNQVGGEGQEPRLARATLHALGRLYDALFNLNHDDDLTGSSDAAITGVIEQLTVALVKQPTDVVAEALLSVAQERTRSAGSRFALFTIFGETLEDKRRPDDEARFGYLREMVTKRANAFVKVLVDTRKERQDPEGPAFLSALHVVKISKRKIADFEGLEPFITQELARGSFRMGADHAFAEFLLDIDPNYPGLIDFVLRLLRNPDRDFGHSDLTALLPRFGDKATLFVPELAKLLQLRSKQAFDAGTSRQVFIQGGKAKELAEALGTLGPIAKDALPLLHEISATPLPTEGVFSEASKTKNQRQYEKSVTIVKALKVAVDKAIEQIKEAPKPVGWTTSMG